VSDSVKKEEFSSALALAGFSLGLGKHPHATTRSEFSLNESPQSTNSKTPKFNRTNVQFHAAAMLLRSGIAPQRYRPPRFIALDNRFIWGYKQMRMYDWDETKRAKNLANHGVDFALIEAFDWEQAIIEKDERRDYPEERYRAPWLHR
jgi:hypothetical protein